MKKSSLRPAPSRSRNSGKRMIRQAETPTKFSPRPAISRATKGLRGRPTTGSFFLSDRTTLTIFRFTTRFDRRRQPREENSGFLDRQPETSALDAGRQKSRLFGDARRRFQHPAAARGRGRALSAHAFRFRLDLLLRLVARRQKFRLRAKHGFERCSFNLGCQVAIWDLEFGIADLRSRKEARFFTRTFSLKNHLEVKRPSSSIKQIPNPKSEIPNRLGEIAIRDRHVAGQAELGDLETGV
jgi:hypothetical protein